VAVVAVVALAFVVANPFRGGGPASPSAVAVASARATDGPATTPGASPTTAPTTAIVTFAPIVPAPTPTAFEVPTEAPSDAPAGQVCRSDLAGITVTYPQGWHTVEDDPAFACMLFDPDPIVIEPQTELPPVAVLVYEDPRPFSEVAGDFETATVYTVLQSESGTFGDRNASVWELENTGEGFYEKGVLQVVVVIDRGDQGTLVLETVGVAGDEYDANVEALGGIVESIQVD